MWAAEGGRGWKEMVGGETGETRGLKDRRSFGLLKEIPQDSGIMHLFDIQGKNWINYWCLKTMWLNIKYWMICRRHNHVEFVRMRFRHIQLSGRLGITVRLVHQQQIVDTQWMDCYMTTDTHSWWGDSYCIHLCVKVSRRPRDFGYFFGPKVRDKLFGLQAVDLKLTQRSGWGRLLCFIATVFQVNTSNLMAANWNLDFWR